MEHANKTILVADDDQAIRFVLEHALSRAGFQVKTFEGGRKLLEHVDQVGGDLVITDIAMPDISGLDLLKTLKKTLPDIPVIVITAQSTLNNAVQSFERGAYEYLSKPFDINKIVDLTKRALKPAQRPTPATTPKEEPLPSSGFSGFIGSSRAMQELFRTIGRLSNTEMTVLIHGESGTGKELVARSVHSFSPRREGPMTAINMAAIPKNLIESELFGHEKGAFTGAISQRNGHFERARGGTLFLDEIGDMPMDAQTRLLRVLQDGTFTRVGGIETIKSDVRIIAATHQDLPAAISEGRFREDLFYRLNVIPLHVPALRTRREDIPILAEHFLTKAAEEMNIKAKRLAPDCLDQLIAHDWPGNVRELENLIYRLMVLVPDDIVTADRLKLIHTKKSISRTENSEPQENQPETPRESPLRQAVTQELDRYFATLDGLPASNVYDAIVHQVEGALFSRVLSETNGNQVKASQILGINRNTLRKKIRQQGINPKK
ncbi:MAG: nitrogen regulation protein NR(I) [Magnetococcales bacterium]|nr:nitrogen regulation protein NR(I) [Magnetococcales bacterium]